MKSKFVYRCSIVKFLNKYAFGKRRFLLLNFSLSLLLMSISFVNPLFYKMFINKVILQKRLEALSVVVIGYLSLFILKYIILILKNYSRNCIVNRTMYRIKYSLWTSFFSNQQDISSIGNMKMLIDDDMTHLEGFVDIQTIDYIVSFFTICISAFLLFMLEWHLAIFSVIAIPLTFWLDSFVSKREKKLNIENRKNDQELSSWLHASLNGWREIRALRLEKKQKYRFAEYSHKYAVYFSKWINLWITRSLVITKIKDDFFMRFSLYFIGGLLIMNHKLSIGNLLVFATYYEILSNAMNSMATSDANLQASTPFIDNITCALSARKNMEKRSLMLPAYDAIQFRNVTFSYPDSDVKVVNNLSFTINSGDRVAIVGKSGSGKTTLLKLMMGLVRPAEGEVCWGDRNLNDINLDNLYRKVGIVTQDSILYNASFKDNLLYAKPDATDEEIVEACKMSHISEYIEALPEKYDTNIGEHGIKLSGGQRQRLVLARLFLRDVDTYILDEATSALDQHNDMLIQEALENIAKTKTVIIVAHRESSIRLCEYKIELM